MNFYKNIRYLGSPEIIVKEDGTPDATKNKICDLNDFSILHNIGFEISNNAKKIKIETGGERYVRKT